MLTGLLTPAHIALILIVALLVLGPKRLPETGRALGRGMREFRDAITGNGQDPEADTTIPPHISQRTPSPARPPGEGT